MNFKDASIGFIAAIIIVAALYFFYFLPEVDKAYKRGLNELKVSTDTLYIKGKDSVIVRDTIFSIIKIPEVTKTDSLIDIWTSFDTTFVSGKDTITIQPTVNVQLKDSLNTANWFMRIEHKDFYQFPDTVKIYQPKFIETIKTENDWLITGIGFVSGIIIATILFLLGG